MFKRLNRLRGWWSDRQSRRELARRKTEALALAEIHERLARARPLGMTSPSWKGCSSMVPPRGWETSCSSVSAS